MDAGELPLPPGLYSTTVLIGSADEASFKLWVPPHLLLLALLLIGGLVTSILVTGLLESKVRSSRLQRRIRRLGDRLALSSEDHAPSLARVEVLLEFVRRQLGPVRSVWADLTLLEDRTTEAEQLMTLLERKAGVWERGERLDLPPTLRFRFLQELALFDRELRVTTLPLAPAAFATLVFDSLDRASELLDSDKLDFAASVKSELQARSRPSPAASTVSGAQRSDDIDGLLRDIENWERMHLEQLAGIEDPSNRQLREIDLRLDIQRRAQAARTESRAVHDRDELEQAWASWREQDPRLDDGAQIPWPLLFALSWSPENRAIDKLLLESTAGDEPKARVDTDPDWTTFHPHSVRLRLDSGGDEAKAGLIEASYRWRRHLMVDWEWSRDGTAWTPDFASAPIVVVGARHRPTGPEAFAYASSPGRIWLRARFRARTWADEDTRVSEPVELRVRPGLDARRSRHLLRLRLGRHFVSIVLTAVAAGIWADTAVADPRGYWIYAEAFAWPFSVPVAVNTVAGLFGAMGKAVAARRPAATRSKGPVGPSLRSGES